MGDGVTLPDALELPDTPPYGDFDEDGISDVLEGRDEHRNTDGDSREDWQDHDSDNDRLGDGQEDLNGNGVLDPGESDPHVADTDADGFDDLLEWAGASDAQDPGSVPDTTWIFVLPLFDPSQERYWDFIAPIKTADLFFDIDSSGSMGGTIDNLKNSLQTQIIPQVAMEVPGTAYGTGRFNDFPISPFGGTGDTPFQLTARITTDPIDLTAGFDALVAMGGNDAPCSGYESIYQAATGEGIMWTGPVPGEVPKFEPLVGFDPAKGHGLIGGAGFRVGSVPIIVYTADVEATDASTYWAAGIADAHTRDEAVAAINGIGGRFVGITSSTAARPALEALATDTGAVVSPLAWGPSPTFCHTGTLGAPRPPDSTGRCPLVFDMDWSGAGIDMQLVDGITALMAQEDVDLSGLPVADPSLLPALDTSSFVTRILPLPPAPPYSSIDGDVFRDVRPGTPITFTVHVRNTMVAESALAKIFRVELRMMGDGVSVLQVQPLWIVVPAMNP